MAQNDFKSFAVGAGANVTSQAEWEALAALVTGFQSGKASSAQINKAIRQASFIAAALAQYTSDKTGGDVLDDGDQAAFITKMAAAFGKDFQPLDSTLTALATLTGAADKLAYFNGEDTAALTALTSVGRELIGKTSVADVLTYLGLGGLASGTFPIGQPFFWPSATLPNLLLPEWSNMVFLKFNNATFSATTYPKLAQIFPSLVLPDARGDFPRIWDDGRGLDSGRSLLSEQGDAIRNIVGYTDSIYGQVTGARTGPYFNSNVPSQRYNTTTSSGVDTYTSIGFDASRVVPVAGENRPINIAFNLLVRAA